MENKHKIFKGLSDPSRILILGLVKKGEICSCDLCSQLDIPLSTLAHHMKVLCESGLVNPRKEGKWIYYSICIEQFEKAVNIITQFIV
jgi:ArsR family transcriptional regulator